MSEVPKEEILEDKTKKEIPVEQPVPNKTEEVHQEKVEENHEANASVHPEVPTEQYQVSPIEEGGKKEDPVPVDDEQKPPENVNTTESKKGTNDKLSSSQKSQKQKQQELTERRKKLLEEQNVENQKADEAAKNSKVILPVECCVLCVEHQYCTHHKEEKYKDYMKLLKFEIEKWNPEFFVCKNYKISKPQLGALEVVYKDVVIYSKLKEMKWPNAEDVAKKLKAAVEQEKENKIKAEKEAAKKAEEESLKKEELEQKKIEAENQKRLNEDIKKQEIAEQPQGQEPIVHSAHKEDNKENVQTDQVDPESNIEKDIKKTEEEEEKTEEKQNVLGERDLNQERSN